MVQKEGRCRLIGYVIVDQAGTSVASFLWNLLLIAVDRDRPDDAV